MTTERLARMGQYSWELGSKDLAELQDCNAQLHDPAALQRRLDDDGYLLIRGMHQPATVEAARLKVLAHLESQGLLQPGTPLTDAQIGPKKHGAFLGGHQPVTHSPEFLAVVNAPPLLEFFTRLLGGPAMTYDFKWLRAVVEKEFTGFHYDVVYMGRGTQRLYTTWTPLGDCPLSKGPLLVILGSHKFQKVRDTYGKMDVDRDNVAGWFSGDPMELLAKHGGQLATTNFRAGDVLIFGMYTMHGSLSNVTDRFRISCDTRYQLASEPVDERWIGDKPIAHYAWGKTPQKPMEEARKEWGV